MKLTIKLRVRDKHAVELNRQAIAINYVWNYCNEMQQKAARDGRLWLNEFQLQQMTAGSSRLLQIHSDSIKVVCKTYARSRDAKRKSWLRWRSRKSLAWVPFNTKNITFNGATFKFQGKQYETMHLRDVLTPGIKIGAGSFNADAKGRWYINLCIDTDVAKNDYSDAVGIDLGLKTLATLSDGQAIGMPRFYRESEQALATAQRAKKTKRTRAIHAKARNRRKDFLHKASTALVKEFGTIIVGDVSPKKMARTSMAKSVYDAGWSDFKTMISYKAMMHGGRMIEVNEAYTTATCSTCGCQPPSRPRGIAGLRIREWTCDDCGTVHDRDHNAALNILRIGLDALAEGVSR